MGSTHRQSREGEGLTRAFGVMSDMSVVKHNDWSAALKLLTIRGQGIQNLAVESLRYLLIVVIMPSITVSRM